MTHAREFALVAAVAIAASSASAVPHAQSPAVVNPLTQPQVEEALKVLTPRRVAGLIRERGTTFILDAAGERRFRTSVSIDPSLLDEIAGLLAPPANPSTGTEWVAPTDQSRMVWISPGTLQMGSPNAESNRDADENLHAVTIASGFWMDSAEVTYRAFRRFLLANPEWQKNRIDRSLHDGNYLIDWKGTDFPAGKAELPVVSVSWHAARAYAVWAGKSLPTEALWEYAARGGRRTVYWWGDSFDAAPANAVSMGTTVKNQWGLTAMLGGVWEWTSSAYRPYPFANDGRNDRSVPGDRVIRGGHATNAAPMLRSANRSRSAPETSSELLGFRCVF